MGRGVAGAARDGEGTALNKKIYPHPQNLPHNQPVSPDGNASGVVLKWGEEPALPPVLTRQAGRGGFTQGVKSGPAKPEETIL